MDQRRHVLPQADVGQHAVAEHAVLLARPPGHLLVAVELQHPDVVEQRGEVEALELLLVELECAPDAIGHLGDAVAVAGVEAEMGVQRVHQHVGHVAEEVALGLAQVGVGGDRQQTGFDGLLGFGQVGGSGGVSKPAARAARMKQSRSILDSVRGELAALSKTLGAGDRRTISQHLETCTDSDMRRQLIWRAIPSFIQWIHRA